MELMMMMMMMMINKTLFEGQNYSRIRLIKSEAIENHLKERYAS
jgi:hypothetical protein